MSFVVRRSLSSIPLRFRPMPPDDPRIAELRELGASIGHAVYFGPEVYVEKDFASLLTIEDGVVLSQGTTVLLHDSSLNNVAGHAIRFSAVTLRSGCYLGANVTILCGVEVGAGALIGACSLVTSDIPAGMVAAGQPARVTASVSEIVERHRQRAIEDPGWIDVPAKPWRDRSDDDNVALYDAITRSIHGQVQGPSI